jgi:alanine racemase
VTPALTIAAMSASAADGHGAESAPVLRIDLDVVRANYAELRRRYRGTVLAAVLKSDAYGLGLEPIAAALAASGCRDFWVNDLDEARRLRATLAGARIHCLMGLAGGHVRDFEHAAAVPALVSLAEIEHCARHAARDDRRIAVAVQLDTGLGRLGLGADEVAFLARTPELLAGLDIRCYVSHLAAYNLPEEPSNDAQRRLLERLVALLPAAPVSLAASSGVYMGEDWHYDIARVGSALFGVQTSIHPQEGLRPCYELSAPILTIGEHPAGRRVGYRGVTELRRHSRIATTAIGYANGLPQGYMNVGAARIGGHVAPLVGGIAMNMTMLDITDIPAAFPLTGARAIFLDAAQPIEHIADQLGCAPNAILTQIGAGTRKTYSGGA